MRSQNIIYCTTGQAAEELGVSLRTIQLWVEKGLLKAWKTEGAHRRISRESVEYLARKKQRSIACQHVAETGGLPDIRPKVLIIENDADMLKLYKRVIASWKVPVKVLVTDTGVEGLILIGRELPDMVVTDLRIFGADGLRLIDDLATTPMCSGMKIVVVTGVDAEQIEMQGGLSKDVYLLPKPVPFDRLFSKVASLAGHQNNVARGLKSGRQVA